MDTSLVLSRAWYVLVGVGAMAYGLGRLVRPVLGGCRPSFGEPTVLPPTGPACIVLVDAPFVAMVIIAGLLALAAALWVRSPGMLRGMLASIGIGVGAVTAMAHAALVALVMSYYDAMPGPAEILIVAPPVVAGTAAAVIMWRGSARPWNETSAIT